MSRTVLCYGDSNTYGFDPRSFLGDRYAKDIRWTGILDGTSDWSVTCCGQNGREIPTQPRQWEEVRELLRQAGPDVFAVMLGSNDLLCRPGFTAEHVAARMEAFLTALAHPRTLLISPPAMVPGSWVTEERLLTESARLAGCYEALAGKLGCAFADAERWEIGLTFDGVHFSEDGHKVFARHIAETLDALLPTSPARPQCP